MYVDDNFPSGGFLKVGPDKIYMYGCVKISGLKITQKITLSLIT
jgi:hypothetical protein